MFRKFDGGDARVFHPQLLVVLQCAALGVWIAAPSLWWALLAGLLGVGSIVLIIQSRYLKPLAAAVAGLLTSGVAIDTSWDVKRVEGSWPELREEILNSAGEVLSEMLDAGVEYARAMAGSAATLVAVSPEDAFEQLELSIEQGGPERGAAVFDTLGKPVAWAGRHRAPPSLSGGEISARITQFYVLLEARRQTGSQIGVGQVVLWADSAVPDRGGTVAEQFSRRTGAGLEFYEPVELPEALHFSA
jgi:hypothetical protein